MNNIIIILPHNPGDVLMGLAVVSELKKDHPHTQIDFVISQECKELVENHPHLSSIHVIPTKEVKENWDQEQPTQCIQHIQSFLQSIKDKKYNLSLNLFQDPFGALIHAQVQSEKKIGFNFDEDTHFAVHHRAMEHLFAVPVARSQNPFHTVDIFLRALEKKPTEIPSIHLPPLPPLTKTLNGLSYFVFQMGSAWRGKRWPLKNWVDLAHALTGKTIVLTGAPQEVMLWEQFQNIWNSKNSEGTKIISMIGKTSLLQTARIIQGAEWLITGDTVAMHLGAAVGTRTLSLFGASNPVETGPYGAGHFIMQSNINIPENLPLSQPSDSLKKISSESIASFLLQGKVPNDVTLWESRWSSKCRLELRNPAGHLHPFQNNSDNMEQALSVAHSENHELKSFSITQGVIKQLEITLANPSSNNLMELQNQDQNLAELTRTNVIWEAYRVAINGMSLADIDVYLLNRKKRLAQTLVELKMLELTSFEA